MLQKKAGKNLLKIPSHENIQNQENFSTQWTENERITGGEWTAE